MKCTIVTMSGCSKCMTAKVQLRDVPGVVFTTNESIEGTILVKTHNLDHAPAFCFDDGFFTYSLLEARKRLLDKGTV